MEYKKCYSSLHGDERLTPLEDFGVNRASPDGRSTVCKSCTNLAHAARRKKDSTHLKENSRRYYQKNTESYAERKNRGLLTPNGCITKLVAQARCRARDAGLEFNITAADIVIPSHCPVLGTPLILGASRTTKDSSPSIDRVDSSKGYTKDNILIVSWKANRLKSNATLDEMRKLYEFYSTIQQ